ncbi:hypothetical protein F4604DRAFT_1681739 [Suillus subluteus]|nr:hypothetical protein F4604DRAFT_1681739 [Suillus subluteus]
MNSRYLAMPKQAGSSRHQGYSGSATSPMVLMGGAAFSLRWEGGTGERDNGTAKDTWSSANQEKSDPTICSKRSAATCKNVFIFQNGFEGDDAVTPISDTAERNI